MKIALTLSAGIMLCAGAAFGQAGFIGLYVNESYSVWCYDDFGPTGVSFYAVHRMTQGATASQWILKRGGNWNCVYMSEVVHMPSWTGSTLSGITLNYGGCFVSDILLVTIEFICQGESPSCSYLEIVGDPASASGNIEVVDCTLTTLYGSGGKVYMNPDLSCPWCNNPTRETNWGQVKALYQ